eukprot:210982_1
MNNKTDFMQCAYTQGLFWTVQDKCPLTFPHNLKYNHTEVIQTDISITSTNDNILTELNDVCVNDTYTIYDSNTVYCNNLPMQQIVRYNNTLYHCQWWTQSETPGIETVWKFMKNCNRYTNTFIKGNIEPFGEHTILKDNVLNIDITL